MCIRDRLVDPSRIAIAWKPRASFSSSTAFATCTTGGTDGSGGGGAGGAASSFFPQPVTNIAAMKARTALRGQILFMDWYRCTLISFSVGGRRSPLRRCLLCSPLLSHFESVINSAFVAGKYPPKSAVRWLKNGNEGALGTGAMAGESCEHWG